jgi:voltage-gated potassium channel
MQRAIRRVTAIAALLLMFTVIGMVGFHNIEGWSWFDSLWMVIITYSTVGYSEVHPLSHGGRIFTMILIASGVGLVYFAIGALTATLLEFELGKVFGRRRMEREIDKLSGHFIICGAGRVGMSVARELSRKPVPFVIIEHAKAHGDQIDERWLILQGDATAEKTLRQSRIDRAAGLIAATTTDATNIYIVLTARSLNPKLKIIARASEEVAEKHLKTAGADTVISPYAFAGHRIANSLLRPNVVDFLDIAVSRDAHEEMVIEEIHVDERSRLAGTTVGSSFVHRDFGAMILGIKRANGDPVFNPRAEEPIRAGDHLIVMGEVAKLNDLEKVAVVPGSK